MVKNGIKGKFRGKHWKKWSLQLLWCQALTFDLQIIYLYIHVSDNFLFPIYKQSGAWMTTRFSNS